MRLHPRRSSLLLAVSLFVSAAFAASTAVLAEGCASSESGFTPGDGGPGAHADGSSSGAPDGGRYYAPDGAPLFGPDGAPIYAPDGAPLYAPDGAPLGPPAGQDGSVAGNDGSVTPAIDAGPPDAAQGSCTPGEYRCSSSTGVETCNSSGTAWLYSSTCAVACSNGLCTGQCTPGALRCNANNVEECDATGTTWNVQQSCTASCTSGACDLVALDVTSNQNLDGEIWVNGAVDIHSGATLNSPTGNLTIHATSITVENGGSIAVAPTGATTAGQGQPGFFASYDDTYYGGGGGGYGTMGVATGYAAGGGSVTGSTLDDVVQPGSAGGPCAYTVGGGVGGPGGGVLRLLASTISVAGQITANGGAGGHDTSGYGGGGGGSGGGILLAADSITVSGSVSAAGGSGGLTAAAYGTGASGGLGRIKVLYGSQQSVTGTLTGTVTQGLLPPIPVTSTSHPLSTLVYNDGFTSLDLSWNKAFPSSQGYYVLLNQTAIDVPTPAAGVQFLAGDFTSFPPASLFEGANYFHIAPVNSTSDVGTVESTFEVQINTQAPGLTSSSHPDQTAWVTNPNAYFQWTFPQGNANVVGAYYVLDAYGDTVPTAADTFVPVSQLQLLVSNLANGIWVMHVVSVDHQGYLTNAGASYRVNIGTDPGEGTVLGQVVDGTGAPIVGATVSINRGLYTQTTNSTGNYNFTTVPAESYELDVSATGHNPVTKSITVSASNPTTVNVSLP